MTDPDNDPMPELHEVPWRTVDRDLAGPGLVVFIIGLFSTLFGQRDWLAWFLLILGGGPRRPAPPAHPG